MLVLFIKYRHFRSLLVTVCMVHFVPFLKFQPVCTSDSKLSLLCRELSLNLYLLKYS